MTPATFERFSKGFNQLIETKGHPSFQKFKNIFDKLFCECDILAMPVRAQSNPQLNDHVFDFCNILDFPAVVVSGIQYIAKTRHDKTLLQYLTLEMQGANHHK